MTITDQITRGSKVGKVVEDNASCPDVSLCNLNLHTVSYRRLCTLRAAELKELHNNCLLVVVKFNGDVVVGHCRIDAKYLVAF